MNPISDLLERFMPEPNNSGRMLGALNRSGKHIYAGTVDPAVVARRRAKNRQARKSRRINRGQR